MKVVQGLSVSLTAGVVRKFCKKKNTLTNIESIPRIRNLASVHTYKRTKVKKGSLMIRTLRKNAKSIKTRIFIAKIKTL